MKKPQIKKKITISFTKGLSFIYIQYITIADKTFIKNLLDECVFGQYWNNHMYETHLSVLSQYDFNEVLEFLEYKIDKYNKGISKEVEAIKHPKDYTFQSINEFVHDCDTEFEELQYALLGIASSYEKKEEEIHNRDKFINMLDGQLKIQDKAILRQQTTIKSQDFEIEKLKGTLEKAYKIISNLEFAVGLRKLRKSKLQRNTL